MILARRIRAGLGAIVGIFLLGGCTTTFAKRDVSYMEVELAQPESEIVEAELLGVRIKPFQPGEIPEEEDESRGLSKEIRKAEGYYSAVQLRNAIQQSGYWGPVRVVPTAVTGGEVIVTGRILESDGEILKLEVSVHDATGSLWFTSEYEEVVDTEAYDRSENGVEAFQYLYNRIANDIAQHREKIVSKEIASIRQVAELKFAADFAPDTFEGYLVKDEPRKEATSFWSNSSAQTEKSQIFKVAQLPADDDPMLARIRRIHAREEALVDTLDLQYERLSREIVAEYTQWRIARLNEMNAVREVEKKRNEKVGKAIAIGVLGVVVGVGIAVAGGKYSGGVGGAIAGAAAGAGMQLAIQASQQAEEDMEIHKAALEELGDSLTEDLKVTVVQVEGETVELRGSAEAKFKQWREILKEIHEHEVGTLQSADPVEVEPTNLAEVQPTDSPEVHPADPTELQPTDSPEVQPADLAEVQPARPIPVVPGESEMEVGQP